MNSAPPSKRPSQAYAPQAEDLSPTHMRVRSRILWLVPLLLSAAFVVVMIFIFARSDSEEREKQRQTMIADALSLEAQLRSKIDSESANLQLVARLIRAERLTRKNFATSPEVIAGLRRFWLSITWLDEQNRLVGHAPLQSELPLITPRGVEEQRGISLHIVNQLTDEQGQSQGSLVVRYSTVAMLKRDIPWWLARKYDVRFVDGADQEIAAVEDLQSQATPSALSDNYRVSLEPTIKDTFLELTQRQRFAPWYQALPLTLMMGFLALIAASTWLLWQQMREVARAENAWRTEAAWRGAIEDSAVVGLRARDLSGRIVYVNRTFAEMVGFSADTLLGLMPPMPYWLPDETEEGMERHRRNMEGRAPREGYEATWRHGDGRTLIVMVFETPLVDARGKQVGWMGSILDVTERREIEARERRQITTLQHNARLTMLGEVASTLAHELNQPLSAIVSYNAGVINSLHRDGFDDTVVLGALERLGEQAKNAGRIVQRIRAFLTRRTPQLEDANLEPIVRAAAGLLKREFDNQKVAFEIRQNGVLPLVAIDTVLVEQVLINLLRNAIDSFADQPGVIERKINVTLQAAGTQWVRVDVADNGPGLAGKTLEQLCAPFYSTKTDGMGMGLAICRSIVEAHGGAFEASDTYRTQAGIAAFGATFSFSLSVSLSIPQSISLPLNLAPAEEGVKEVVEKTNPVATMVLP
jgi:two-component system, LuxR family, sensor histidine kinase DctS